MQDQKFQPFVPDESKMAEFTVKSVLVGAAFGIIFGAATVYLALKAGLTVSAFFLSNVSAYSMPTLSTMPGQDVA